MSVCLSECLSTKGVPTLVERYLPRPQGWGIYLAGVPILARGYLPRLGEVLIFARGWRVPTLAVRVPTLARGGGVPTLAAGT